jgi:predicted RNA polymerase sigma factor
MHSRLRSRHATPGLRPLRPQIGCALLDKLGRHQEAQAESARAATMTQNEQERPLLLNRASGRPAGQASP